MVRVIRRIGGAGTGKTTAQQVDMNRAREELGLAPEQIGATTFTRNGREVMAARAAQEWGCGVDALTKHGWFRTVHSIAKQQLGVTSDEILAGDAAAMVWVSEAIGAEIDVELDENDEPMASAVNSDAKEAALALNAWNYSRSTLTPLPDVLDAAAARGAPTLSYEAAKRVIERYETGKRVEGRVDFHDLLCRYSGVYATVDGFSETRPEGDPPEDVKAWFFDEAQDSSALVDRVCRRLAYAPGVERALISGDLFQSIFGFGGSDYRHFLSWKAEQEIMPRSYRCPADVMDLGERCLMEMRDGYFDRQIAPADHDGAVEVAASREDALGMVDPSESTLILARCNFTLRDYEKMLDARQIPWRPLKYDNSEALAGFQTLWTLQNNGFMDNQEWLAALEVLAASHRELGPLLRSGVKEEWRTGRWSHWDVMLNTDLEEIGCTRPLAEAIIAGDWPSLLLPKYQRLASRWVESAQACGPELASKPRISLATIHAAKGAEGDTVILGTETSKRIEISKRLSDERHDEECRIAYVGVTRARKRLIVVRDSTRHRMCLPL